VRGQLPKYPNRQNTRAGNDKVLTI